MPPKRRAAKAPIRGRRQAEVTRGNEVPADYYNEMLSEASAVPTSSGDEGRAIKKRKTSRRSTTPVTTTATANGTPQSAKRQLQVVFDDYATEDNSDIDFEDVDLEASAVEGDHHVPETAADRATDLNIAVVVNQKVVARRARNLSRRLPSSTIEKQKRIDVHKVHLCCLLAHVYNRNAWCNDEHIQHLLMKILDKKTKTYLQPAPSESQFQRSRSLQDGLQQAVESFRIAFSITARGTRRPVWKTDPLEIQQLTQFRDTETAIDRHTFTQLAKKRQGSRDVGAQLFCALLRGAGVDVRLVCSLQPLPFASLPPVASPKKQKQTIRMTASDSETGHSGSDSARSSTSSVIGNGVTPKIPPPVKRFGRGAAGAAAAPTVDLGQAPSPVKQKKYKESNYPIYWVEVFDEAYQKWLAVDPLMTRTVNKPQKFEPPASDSMNDMSYVIAYNEDGSARDVTRRYAKAYNAKTRRSRVEVTKDGKRWWKRAFKIFKGAKEDRDQVEDAELAKKESSEPMPRNVLDFKDHPYYALERHLKHNEVIEPKREAGKLSTGKGADAIEPIYRRQDVQVVRSADKWYRGGREIKPGEQPLKYGTRRQTRRNRSPSPDEREAGEADEAGLALYAHHQTSMYIPKPVVDGRIPRNAFGNLDLYTSTMIPPGSVHIRAIESARAAKILGIDFADAVTGFKFQGRRGTAIVDGTVVAAGSQEAIVETILGLRWQAEHDAAEKRAREAERMWKKFLIGLRVRERIMGYEVEGQDKNEKVDQQVKEKMNEADRVDDMKIESGGFMPDADQAGIAQPTGSGGQALEEQPPDPTFDINAFADTKHNKETLSADSSVVIVVPSPWDEGGSLYHANPYKPGTTVESSSMQPRKKPQLPRTHTPGLFLSPTRPDQELEDGGGFFPGGEANKMTGTGEGGFVVEDGEEGGRFVVDRGDDAVMEDADQEHDDLFEEDYSTEREEVQKLLPISGEGQDVKMSGAADAASSTSKDKAMESESSQGKGKVKKKKTAGSDDGTMSETSLLSHDEEDEEMEPDWLVDEIGW